MVVDQGEAPQVFVTAGHPWGYAAQIDDRLAHLLAISLQDLGKDLDTQTGFTQIDAHEAQRAVGVDGLHDGPLHEGLLFFRQRRVAFAAGIGVQHARALISKGGVIPQEQGISPLGSQLPQAALLGGEVILPGQNWLSWAIRFLSSCAGMPMVLAAAMIWGSKRSCQVSTSARAFSNPQGLA